MRTTISVFVLCTFLAINLYAIEVQDIYGVWKINGSCSYSGDISLLNFPPQTKFMAMDVSNFVGYKSNFYTRWLKKPNLNNQEYSKYDQIFFTNIGEGWKSQDSSTVKTKASKSKNIYKTERVKVIANVACNGIVSAIYCAGAPKRITKATMTLYSNVQATLYREVDFQDLGSKASYTCHLFR